MLYSRGHARLPTGDVMHSGSLPAQWQSATLRITVPTAQWMWPLLLCRPMSLYMRITVLCNMRMRYVSSISSTCRSLN